MWGISELSESAYLVMKDPAPCRLIVTVIFLYSWLYRPGGPRHPLWGSWITFRQATFGTIPLDEWSARRRELYLTTHNAHNKQISIPPLGCKPALPASERPRPHAFHRGYIGARTDTTEQTNICLGIHRQTRVATFNPTCLSILLATHGLLVLSLLFVMMWTVQGVRVWW